MQLPKPKFKQVRPFATSVLICYALSLNAARAEILPWLAQATDDPFAMRQKASNQIAPALRPDSCQLPDLKRILTLDDVVISTLCNNPDTKSAYLNLVAQAATYVSNYSAYLPNANGTISRNRSTTISPATGGVTNSVIAPITSSFGLSLGMTLYDFGQREFKIETAEQAFLAAGQIYNSTLQTMISNALQGYYSLLNAQNALTVAKETEEFTKESYDAAVLRHRIGQVALADELQARNNYSQAQLATETAQNARVLQQAALAQLMGFSPDEPINVADIDNNTLAKDPFGGRVQGLMVEAKLKRHDLQASRYSLKSSEASYKALKRSDLATVSLTTNLGVTDPESHIFNSKSTRSQGIGLNVSIPLFTGFNQTYNEHAAEESLKAQRESLVTTERNVETSVWDSWHNYETAKVSWKTSRDQIASAVQLKDVALGQYKEGLNSILDLLNAQLQYSAALQSQLQTRYNLLTTRVALVQSVGVLDLESINSQAVLDAAANTDLKH